MGEYVARLLAAFGAEQHALEGDAWRAGLVDPLSVRDVEILRLVCDRLCNKEIADRLVLSVGTVKRHLHNISGRLGVRDGPQTIASAIRLGIAGNRLP